MRIPRSVFGRSRILRCVWMRFLKAWTKKGCSASYYRPLWRDQRPACPQLFHLFRYAYLRILVYGRPYHAFSFPGVQSCAPETEGAVGADIVPAAAHQHHVIEAVWPRVPVDDLAVFSCIVFPHIQETAAHGAGRQVYPHNISHRPNTLQDTCP